MKLRGDLSPHSQVLPVLRTESAERKHAQETAAAEENQQCGAERPTGDGVSHEDKHARDQIELRAVAHGLEYTQRKAEEAAEDESGEAEKNGSGEPGLDPIPDGVLVNVRPAQIEVHDAPEPLQ